MRNNKGVTLVALVITIIVLLILAGVSLAMLTGENGILTNASSAKTETLKSNYNGGVDMTYMELKTESYVKAAADFTPAFMKGVAEHYLTAKEATVAETTNGITITPADATLGLKTVTITYVDGTLTRTEV